MTTCRSPHPYICSRARTKTCQIIQPFCRSDSKLKGCETVTISVRAAVGVEAADRRVPFRSVALYDGKEDGWTTKRCIRIGD